MARPYANPLIFLFLGGFLIAQAMQTWRLHRRSALGIVQWGGTPPNAIVYGSNLLTIPQMSRVGM